MAPGRNADLQHLRVSTPPPPGGADAPPAAGPTPPRHQQIWGPALLPLALGLIAVVTGSAGARMLNPLPVSSLSTLTLTVTYLAALGGAAALLHLRKTWSQQELLPTGSPTAPQAPTSTAPDRTEPTTAADTTADDLLDRVRVVLAEKHPDIIIVAGSVTYNDNGQVNAFSLKTTVPSAFADPTLREKLFQRVSESIDGRWNMTADPRRDMLHLRTKRPYPSAVAPPMPDRVASSAAAALEIYRTLCLRLGVDEDGRSLDLDIQAFPHWLFIGGTGSGKSVFVRGAVIEPFRAAGAMLLIGDGKGTDYTNLIGLPGIVAVSQSTADHMRLVRLAADELRARRADAQNIQFSRTGENPFQRPPIVLILDEFATMMANIKGEFGKDGVELFLADLKFLVRVGREFKVHVGIASQEAYREIIDGQLMGNLQLRVSLGPPEDKTITEVFPPKLQAAAKRIGSSINKKRDIGRALAFMASDDDDVVVEFQSYYGYTPNPSKPPPPPIAADHERYRTEISERIPKLYPRLWWKIDGPDYARPLSEGGDLDALYSTCAVVLDDAHGDPDPAHTIYDPLHPDYLGRDNEGGPPIPSLTELQSGATYTPAPSTARPAPADLDDEGAGQPAAHHEPPPAPEWSADPFNSPGPPPEWARDPEALPAADDHTQHEQEPHEEPTSPSSPSPPDEPNTEDQDDEPGPPWALDDPPAQPRPRRVPPPPPDARPNTGAVNI